jgi:hypothetical protein
MHPNPCTGNAVILPDLAGLLSTCMFKRCLVVCIGRTDARAQKIDKTIQSPERGMAFLLTSARASSDHTGSPVG